MQLAPWPPQSITEALVLGLALVVLRLVIDLWFLPADRMAVYHDPRLAALAFVEAGLPWLSLALALALAARALLSCTIPLALGIGALLLLPTSIEPVLTRFAAPLATPLEREIAGVACVVAASAIAGIACRPGPGRILAFMPVAALLALAWPAYGAAHGWLLDLAGLSVRGTMVHGLDAPQRGILNELPAFVLVGALWLALGGAEARRMWRVLRREWPPPQLALAVLALLWGYVLAARGTGQIVAPLQPPAIYGALGALLALAACAAAGAALRARHRGRMEALSRGDIVALLVIAAALALVDGWAALGATALFAATLFLLAWPLGAVRPPFTLELLAGALVALSAFAAGGLAVPATAPEDLLAEPLLPAAVAGAGAALAGLAHAADERAGRRAGSGAGPHAPILLWLADYGAAMAIMIWAVGLDEPGMWVGAAAALAALFVVAVSDQGPRHGDRLLGHVLVLSAALLVAATALMAVPRA